MSASCIVRPTTHTITQAEGYQLSFTVQEHARSVLRVHTWMAALASVDSLKTLGGQPIVVVYVCVQDAYELALWAGDLALSPSKGPYAGIRLLLEQRCRCYNSDYW